MVLKNCPHCQGHLNAHDDSNPFKIGAQHCDSCGCCFDSTGNLRAGHQPCKLALAAVVSEPEVVNEPIVVEEPTPEVKEEVVVSEPDSEEPEPDANKEILERLNNPRSGSGRSR